MRRKSAKRHISIPIHVCQNAISEFRGARKVLNEHFLDEKTCRNALLRRAAGPRNRTAPYVLLSHIAIP